MMPARTRTFLLWLYGAKIVGITAIVIYAIVSAHAAPAKPHAQAWHFGTPCGTMDGMQPCRVETASLPQNPIRIQCPCDLHVRQQDGAITLSGAGTLTVGPKTTDYSGGSWSSDAPVSFDNHAPDPKPERDR